MTITELMQQAWQTAEDKGWHDRPRTLLEELALMHSELSEAVEDYRNGDDGIRIVGPPGFKPEGLAVELADCVIRIAECCQHRGIPLEQALVEKLAYNKTRPVRHGGKRA